MQTMKENRRIGHLVDVDKAEIIRIFDFNRSTFSSCFLFAGVITDARLDEQSGELIDGSVLTIREFGAM
jgi:hypothetical protein